MRVAIKVDGNKKLGLGHVMRCLAVAKQLKKNKIRVIFIIGDNSIKKIIENEKFFTYFLDKREQEPKSIKKIIISEKINVIIIDSKKKYIK